MRRTVLFLLLSSAFAGCMAEAKPSSECRDDPTFFVIAQHHPGGIGPEYQYMFYTLDRDGRFYYFRAQETDPNGTGQLNIRPGGLHNTNETEVRRQLERVGIQTQGRDHNVSLAYKDTASSQRFDAFCGVLLGEFYSYRASYENDRILDCDGFTFQATTAKGTHKSYSYCEQGPDGTRDAFDEMRKDSWERFGLNGL